MFHHGGRENEGKGNGIVGLSSIFSANMPGGKFPFRRTLEFLSAGRLILKSNVKTVLLNYTHRKESLGLR